MMQKLRFTRFKQLTATPEAPAPDTLATEGQTSTIQEPLTKRWSRFIPSLLFLAEIGGLVLVVIVGMNILTSPSTKNSHASSCQSKLAGNWQTNWGDLAVEEKGNSEIVGRYEFYNLNRGKVKGQISGTLDRATFNFDWQENAEKGQSQQQGKGVFTFSENCQEFTGSYGTGSITDEIGWQGRIIPTGSKPTVNFKPAATKPNPN
ncbi:hypothetical protein TUMEXPCC7403_12620 [Tumidithrix helvetica PCC 7403]|uniref:hypothetical protein n=1 Tax=Tumidithrix helvetica TaxID=3457545 RepID=UPI003CBB1767